VPIPAGGGGSSTDLLATPDDLRLALQNPVLDDATATMLLELATAKVRRAAGGQLILDATDVAVIDVLDLDQWIDLPQRPIRAVIMVVLDGTVITDWRLVNQRLWRLIGWLTRWDMPSQAAVTYSHGYPDGSRYLQLARSATLSLAAAGYGNPSGVTSESIDDYRVSYDEAAGRMELTEHTAASLRAQYGSSAYVTGTESQ
jgi:hypothetical protein